MSKRQTGYGIAPSMVNANLENIWKVGIEHLQKAEQAVSSSK
jgi:hypothetical protein